MKSMQGVSCHRAIQICRIEGSGNRCRWVSFFRSQMVAVWGAASSGEKSCPSPVTRLFDRLNSRYDAGGNLIQTVTRERYHNAAASQTGELKAVNG